MEMLAIRYFIMQWTMSFQELGLEAPKSLDSMIEEEIIYILSGTN